MLTDADCVRLCSAIYNPVSKWDRYFDGTAPDGICAGVKLGIESDVVVFRGSITQEDWFRDLKAKPYPHPVLGGVEFGFMEGLDEFFSQVTKFLGQRTIICGHSLGAARALLFGALLTAAGRAPTAIVTFGSPLPGFIQLAQILKTVPIHSYKNRYDPVTCVPFPIYPDYPYMHPRGFINLNVKPPLEDFSVFADHHINLYEAGIVAAEA